MDAEVLDLRDRLAAGGAGGRGRFFLPRRRRRRGVSLRVGPKGPQLDAPGRGGAVGVDDDGQEGLVVLLLDGLLIFFLVCVCEGKEKKKVKGSAGIRSLAFETTKKKEDKKNENEEKTNLGPNVDPGEPAPVARVGVVPADKVLLLARELLMFFFFFFLRRDREKWKSETFFLFLSATTTAFSFSFFFSFSFSLSFPKPLTLFVSRKSIMYSFASACALTLVSVPTTGSANASRTTKASPEARPASMPITSRSPPDLACMAIFSKASAEMWTLRGWS